MAQTVFYGWRVVAACFVIAAFAWTLGLFGSSVYLHAVTTAHGWAVSEVSSAITLFFLVSATVQRTVGRSIDRWGPRPVLTTGAVAMGIGVALVGRVTAPWQLFPCFALIGVGWSTLSTTGITATVAPWFERHQGRSMTLAIMGASVGAIAGVPALLVILSRLGLETGLTVVGLGAAALLIPLVWTVLRYRGPSELGQRRDGGLLFDVHAGTAMPTVPRPKRPRVLLYSAATAFALALTVQIGFITHHVALAQPLLGTAGAGWLVSATGLSAFVGRMILATIVDRVDVRRLACAILAAQIAALSAMAMWPTVPVLIAASLVYGYGIGHVTTLGPVVVRREFGAASFGATYGAAATIIQLTSAFGPALFGIMRDAFGGYATVLWLSVAVDIAACLALWLGRPGGRAAGD